ncbi:hypothetical protein ACN24K_23645 [Streptomyces microflavus]
MVLVERQNADVARWLGLAAVTLPRESVERLTFTTYTRRPGSSALRVVGRCPRTPRRRGRRGCGSMCADRPPVDGTPDMWARTAARCGAAGRRSCSRRRVSCPGTLSPPGRWP